MPQTWSEFALQASALLTPSSIRLVAMAFSAAIMAVVTFLLISDARRVRRTSEGFALLGSIDPVGAPAANRHAQSQDHRRAEEGNSGFDLLQDCCRAGVTGRSKKGDDDQKNRAEPADPREAHLFGHFGKFAGAHFLLPPPLGTKLAEDHHQDQRHDDRKDRRANDFRLLEFHQPHPRGQVSSTTTAKGSGPDSAPPPPPDTDFYRGGYPIGSRFGLVVALGYALLIVLLAWQPGS